MRPDISEKINAEFMKQFNDGFLAVTSYPQWVANIVPVPKKDGKVRMCMDYRDLNRASPKDDFPLPHIDILVDNTAQNKVFSFMDGFSGYNQIKMAPEDIDFCHTVGYVLLQSDVVWTEECRGNLSTRHGSFVS